MRTHLLIGTGLFAAACMALTTARALEVTGENVDGIVNFHRLETTVACTAAIKPDTLPKIQKMGFVIRHQFAGADRGWREHRGGRRGGEGGGPAILQHPIQFQFS